MLAVRRMPILEVFFFAMRERIALGQLKILKGIEGKLLIHPHRLIIGKEKGQTEPASWIQLRKSRRKQLRENKTLFEKDDNIEEQD